MIQENDKLAEICWSGGATKVYIEISARSKYRSPATRACDFKLRLLLIGL